jgi:hypothetical protein
MDYGIGIAGIAISAGAVAITAIKVKANGNGKSPVCGLHSGIEATLKYLTDGMDEVRDDIKELLKKKGS